jgi:phage gp36-like protein
MEARYPARDLVQLTNEDPAATAVDTSTLVQLLADASAEIDSYLEARFELPLSDPPAVLNRLCCEIAIYRLQAMRPIHDSADARKRYEDAIKFLTEVNQGKLTLGLSPDSQEPPEATDVVLLQAGGDSSGALPQRVFDRGKLRGF